MKRFATIVLALGCASLLAPQASAQSNETKTKTKTEHASTVSYTGCVQTGGQTRTYVLDHVAPIRKTTELNADGSTTTSTTYALVGDSSVQLEPQIGHKVEIQGVLIAAGHGDAKIRTKSEVNGKEEKSKTEVERGSMPQLRVVSVKPLGETCSVN